GDGGVGGEHAAWISEPAKALALGAVGRSLRAGGGVAGIFCSCGKAGAGADLRILSGVRAGNCGRVRGSGGAWRGGQFVCREVSGGGGSSETNKGMSKFCVDEACRVSARLPDS